MTYDLNFFFENLGSGLSTEGQKVDFQMALNSSTFTVLSAGSVNISSGDKTTFNGVGGDINFLAGSGLSKQGGSGGDVLLKSGDGVGEDRFGGAIP